MDAARRPGLVRLVITEEKFVHDSWSESEKLVSKMSSGSLTLFFCCRYNRRLTTEPSCSVWVG